MSVESGPSSSNGQPKEKEGPSSHQEIGQQQQLIMFSDYSPGSCFFLPHGAKIYNKLMKFLRKEYRRRGFEEVITPNIFCCDLWKRTGHWDKYHAHMFSFPIGDKQEGEENLYSLKPMNCPGHCILFGSRTRSYRDLPLRYADFGVLHRNEMRGALHGLTRVRRFCQDDAHIFCRQDQIGAEIEACFDFLRHVYGIFKFPTVDMTSRQNFYVELSTRPEQYIGSIDTWDHAESCLKDVLQKLGLRYEINEGEGAFYGAKIDVHIADVFGRRFQCATIQLDFNLPERMKLEYVTSNTNVKQRPVLIHRAILGSFERFIGILIEHTQGKWPFWLSPRQAMVVSATAAGLDYAQQVRNILFEEGFEVDLDVSDDTLDKKIVMAESLAYNYIIVVGRREQANNTVCLRNRSRAQETMSIKDCLDKFKRHCREYE